MFIMQERQAGREMSIARIKQLLAQAGAYDTPPDSAKLNEFDDEMISAIEVFQAGEKLTIDGFYGGKTHQATLARLGLEPVASDVMQAAGLGDSQRRLDFDHCGR